LIRAAKSFCAAVTPKRGGFLHIARYRFCRGTATPVIGLSLFITR
jgi:hypothetical protein